MGFRGNGSLLLAVGVGLLFCLSVIGLLVTASFARSDGEAANLGASLGVLDGVDVRRTTPCQRQTCSR
ncbi:MAG: hypothetical protein R3E31_30745 [Chloroflexota bacterium]